MLKVTILLLIIIVVALFWTVLRRRLKRGIRVGIVLYAIVMIARLSQVKTDQETLTNLAVILGLFGGLWLAVWIVTNWLLARNSPH